MNREELESERFWDAFTALPKQQFDTLFGWHNILSAVSTELNSVFAIPGVTAIITAYYHSTPSIDHYAPFKIDTDSARRMASAESFVFGGDALKVIRTNGLYVGRSGRRMFLAYRFMKSGGSILFASKVIQPATPVASQEILRKSVIGVCEWMGKPPRIPGGSASQPRQLPAKFKPVGRPVRRLSDGLHAMCVMIGAPEITPRHHSACLDSILHAPYRIHIAQELDISPPMNAAVSSDGKWLQFFEVEGSVYSKDTKFITPDATLASAIATAHGSGGAKPSTEQMTVPAPPPLKVRLLGLFRYVALPTTKPLTAKRWVKS